LAETLDVRLASNPADLSAYFSVGATPMIISLFPVDGESKLPYNIGNGVHHMKKTSKRISRFSQHKGEGLAESSTICSAQIDIANAFKAMNPTTVREERYITLSKNASLW
jgi:hypothetical protein